jgi:LysM repeat protein
VVKTVEPEVKEIPARTVTIKEVTATEEEPQDELSRLKARLDRAVYSRSAPSNIKVSRNDEETIGPNPQTAAPAAARQSQEQNAGAVYHTVLKGETAYSIAQKYQVKMKQLREWNNLNFESIKTGQKLRVK